MPNGLDKKNLNFYVLENGSNNRIGPLSREDLLLGIVSKKYTSTTYAWTGGLKDWLKLSDAYWDKIGVRVQDEESLLVSDSSRPSLPPTSLLVESDTNKFQNEEIFSESHEYLLDELNWVHAANEDIQRNFVCYPNSAEKFTGKAVRRTKSGKILHLANFKDGLPCGEEKTWFNNGFLEKNCTWVKGSNELLSLVVRSGEYCLPANLSGEYSINYENGMRKEQCFFENGKLHGISKGWHEGGERKWYAVYSNGELHGVSEGWYKSGGRKWFGNYSNGKLEGYNTTYNEMGHKQMRNAEGRTKGEVWGEVVGIGCLIISLLSLLAVYLNGDHFWGWTLTISLIVGFFIFKKILNKSGSNSRTSITLKYLKLKHKPLKASLIIYSMAVISGIAYNLWYNSSSQRRERQFKQNEENLQILREANVLLLRKQQLEQEIEYLKNLED